MPIQSFDHVAIPIQNTTVLLAFYRAMQFTVKEREHFYSVHFGDQKTNFHAPERWQSGKFTLARTDISMRWASGRTAGRSTPLRYRLFASHQSGFSCIFCT
jgi:hypothetical protein